MTKVGLPRALLYYQYYPMWRTFFEELGAEVVVSVPTTRAVLAAGSARVVAETCLPTKVYCGHVLTLVDKVDYLFIPSIRSIERNVYNCSKFLGLPDLVRGTIKECPPILDIDIDINKGEKAVRNQIHWLGRHFTHNPFKIDRAIRRALAMDELYKQTTQSGLTPPEALQKLGLDDSISGEKRQGRRPLWPSENSDLKIAVIGHPYNIYDGYINHQLIERLKGMEVEIVTSEMVTAGGLDAGTAKLVGKPYWTYEDEVVGAAGYYLDEDVDGILGVVCFGCGPDSLMIDVIQRAAKTRKNKPLMILTIDEHTGEAGLITRLEAFLDMLRRRGSRLAKRGA
ncbi:MAG: acyl-CoA dehydratase activase-related protein [Chloroflexi bacterium]|nr:acyl-CoA dehydratase activase-related protein [Chloroflexota bacterium]MCL5075240.1 acyl-CoA dehydratase activase-related protein [Chloroflexota bacterium]